MRKTIKCRPLIHDKVVFKVGKKKLVIALDLCVDDIIKNYENAQDRLVKAESMLTASASEANCVEYGEAVIGIIETIFGKDVTKNIIELYDGKYIQLLADFFPYVRDRVLPILNDPFEKVR